MAGNLSIVTDGAPALAVFVFDSDLLPTWLFIDGEIVDRYVPNSDLLEDGPVDEVAEETDEADEPRTDLCFVGEVGTGAMDCAA